MKTLINLRDVISSHRRRHRPLFYFISIHRMFFFYYRRVFVLCLYYTARITVKRGKKEHTREKM